MRYTQELFPIHVFQIPNTVKLGLYLLCIKCGSLIRNPNMD